MGNREWGVLVQLNESGLAAVRQRYDELWAEAQAFDVAVAEAGTQTERMRSPSRPRQASCGPCPSNGS